FGEAGNDTLDGGQPFRSGPDWLDGGAGNDTYYIESSDHVIEAADAGIDTIRAKFSVDLGSHDSIAGNLDDSFVNIENLTLVGPSIIDGFGNALKNKITGNATNNHLDGRDGNDLLLGGNGSDSLDGGAGKDRLEGDAGVDHLTGGSDADIFIFGKASDIGT